MEQALSVLRLVRLVLLVLLAVVVVAVCFSVGVAAAGRVTKDCRSGSGLVDAAGNFVSDIQVAVGCQQCETGRISFSFLPLGKLTHV